MTSPKVERKKAVEVETMEGQDLHKEMAIKAPEHSRLRTTTVVEHMGRESVILSRHQNQLHQNNRRFHHRNQHMARIGVQM